MSNRDKQQTGPYAVALGLENGVGLQTVRILRRHGVPVIGVTKDPRHYCCRTNACERIIEADIESEQLIDTLTALGREFEEKAILFPCTDTCVLLVSRYREQLEGYYRIGLPDNDIVELLMHKPKFYDYALQHNLPIPRFSLLFDRDDALRAAETINFPCILKPPIKTPEWEYHTKIKAFKIEDSAEFLELYEQCSQWTDVLMAQEWVMGGDEKNYSCNAYFNGDSEPLVTFTARKLRQFPPETGNTCLGEECACPEVLNTSLQLFKGIRFKGLAYLEMKKDSRSGQYFIIEPNIGRPTGRSSLAEANGVELVYSMYCDLAGLPLPENRVQEHTGLKWVHLRTDFQSALFYWRRGDLTLRDWFGSLRGKKAYAVLSLSDPRPFFEQFRLGAIYAIANLYKRVCKTLLTLVPRSDLAKDLNDNQALQPGGTLSSKAELNHKEIA